MKIGICVLRLAELQGGNTESIYALAKELEKQNVKIEFLVPKMKQQIPFKTRYFGSSDTFYRPLETKLPKLMIQFVKEARLFSKKVDLLHIYLPTPSLAFLGDLIKNKTEKKVIVNFDSILYDRFLSPGPNIKFSLSLRSLINSAAVAKISRFVCDKYIVSSSYQKKELIKLGCNKDKISIIPNTFNKEKLDSWEKNNKDLRNIPKDDGVISYIGHFNWHKGVDLFVRIMPDILKELKNTHFIIAWSTRGDRDWIIKLAKEINVFDKITFLERTNLKGLFRKTDVLVFPYRVGYGTQSYPNTILEAFYVGTPAVLADVYPINEIANSGKNALLIKPENQESLKRGVIKLLTNKKMAEDFKKNQKNLINTQFLPKIVAKRYIEEVYRNLYEKR